MKDDDELKRLIKKLSDKYQICQIYIYIYIEKPPLPLPTPNGGQFTNSLFLEMCKVMYITVRVTATESPFSNRLVERHNMIIENMLNKILIDQQLDLDNALSWCLNAKNR